LKSVAGHNKVMSKSSFSTRICLAAVALITGQLASGPASGPAFAQGSMQQMLDNIDPNAASQLPTVPAAVQQMSVQQVQTAPTGPTFSQQNPAITPRMPAPAPLQMLRSMFNGTTPQLQQPMPAKKPTMFQALFGDGGAGSDTTSSASGNMYRAENQARYAREACSRSYHGDHWTRSQAADDAYYAAEEARYEADAASAKVGTAGSDPNNQQYSSTARTYAERAQASADTARANADRVWK
jgi:hypothetical protein